MSQFTVYEDTDKPLMPVREFNPIACTQISRETCSSEPRFELGYWDRKTRDNVETFNSW